MKVLIQAAIMAIMATLATPAMAWTNTTGGAGPQQINDGAAGAQAVSRATGGRGGNATSSTGSSVSKGGGATVYAQPGAPAFALAPGFAAGMDCPTVGFGAAGSGLGGGGGFGPSWISPDCNARKLAQQLAEMGQVDAALALLRAHFPEARAALDATTPVPVSAARHAAAWCATASDAEKRRHHQDCFIEWLPLRSPSLTVTAAMSLVRDLLLPADGEPESFPLWPALRKALLPPPSRDIEPEEEPEPAI